MTILPAVVRARSTPRLIAIGLYVFTFAAVGATAPYMPVYFQSIGLPLDAIGLVAALAALCSLIAAPAWGVLADQALGARTALAGAAAIAAICALGVAVSDAAIVAVVLWITYWLAFAGVAPVLDAFALDQVGRHGYSRLRVWGSASFVVVSIAVGLLIEQTQIRSLFVVLILSLVAAALLAARLPARTAVRAASTERRLSGLRVVLRTRVLMAFVGAALVVFSASTMVNGFYSIYLVSLNAPTALVGSAWALGAIVEVPLMLAFPLLAARFGVSRLLIVGALCLLLRALVVVIATDPLIVVAAMALHGAGFALMLVGGVTYVASRAPHGSAATAQGVLAGVVFGLAQAIGPGIAGFVAGATSIHAMFSVAAVTSAVGVAAVVVAVGWAARRAAPVATAS